MNYLKYARGLQFEDRPDYSYLRQLFRMLFHRQGFTYDYVFDWNMLKFGGSRQTGAVKREGMITRARDERATGAGAPGRPADVSVPVTPVTTASPITGKISNFFVLKIK